MSAPVPSEESESDRVGRALLGLATSARRASSTMVVPNQEPNPEPATAFAAAFTAARAAARERTAARLASAPEPAGASHLFARRTAARLASAPAGSGAAHLFARQGRTSLAASVFGPFGLRQTSVGRNPFAPRAAVSTSSTPLRAIDVAGAMSGAGSLPEVITITVTVQGVTYTGEIRR